MRLLVAILVVVLLVTFYFISWKMNSKEKLPEGFKDNLNKCDSCSHTGCSMNLKEGGEEID